MARIEQRGKYYLLIPGPSGKEQRVPIDLDNLRVNHFYEVFEWSTREGRLVRAHGVEAGFSSDIDPTRVLDVFDALVHEIAATLPADGELSAQIRQAALDHFASFRGVIEAVGAGHLHSAEDILRDGMYRYMSAMCDVAQRVVLLDQEASGMHVATQEMLATMVLPERIEDAYSTWQVVCLELLDVYAKLSIMEDEIDSQRIDVEHRAALWSEGSTAWRQTFNEAMTFLDDPTLQNTDTFFLRCSRYLMGESDEVEMCADVDRACALIEQCESLIEAAVDTWRQVRDDTQLWSMRVQKDVDALIDSMRTLLNQHYGFRDDLFRGSMKPYEVEGASLTREQYDRLGAFLSDSRWLPDRALRRLRMLAAAVVDDLGPPPELPEELKSSIVLVRGQIAELEDRMRQMARDGRAHPAGGTSAHGVGPADVPSHRLLDESGMGQLCDFVVIVADEVTCKPQMFALSNVEALVEVVCLMRDNLDRDAVMASVERIRGMVEHPDRCVEVSRMSVKNAWTYSQKMWVRVRDPVHPRASLKLTKSGGRRADELRRQYGIERADVARAKEARDAAKGTRSRKRASDGSSAS